MDEQDKLIDELQRIEAGLLYELTPKLRDVLYHIKRYSDGTPVKEECMICKADLMVCHHICSYKEHRKYNGDSTSFDIVLGLAFLCPNCHHKIHNKNPYFIKANNK